MTATQTQLRRGTTAQVTGMTPALGEVVVNTTDTPAAPTPTAGDSSTKLATTAFVTTALASAATRLDGQFDMAANTTAYANGLSFSRTATGQVTVSHSVGNTSYSVDAQCLSNPLNHVAAQNIAKSSTQFTMNLRDVFTNALTDVTFNVVVTA